MEKFKREFFRLELDSINTTIDIISENNKALQQPKSLSAETRDISGGGMSFKIKKDLNIDSNKPVVANISFYLNDQKFIFTASILRQEKVGEEYLYGCKFENVEKKKRSELTTVLLKIDILKRKEKIEKMIVNRKNRKKM